MPSSISTIVADPEFQKSSPEVQRELLSGVDAEIGKLSPAAFSSFVASANTQGRPDFAVSPPGVSRTVPKELQGFPKPAYDPKNLGSTGDLIGGTPGAYEGSLPGNVSDVPLGMVKGAADVAYGIGKSLLVPTAPKMTDEQKAQHPIIAKIQKYTNPNEYLPEHILAPKNIEQEAGSDISQYGAQALQAIALPEAVESAGRGLEGIKNYLDNRVPRTELSNAELSARTGGALGTEVGDEAKLSSQEGVSLPKEVPTTERYGELNDKTGGMLGQPERRAVAAYKEPITPIQKAKDIALDHVPLYGKYRQATKLVSALEDIVNPSRLATIEEPYAGPLNRVGEVPSESTYGGKFYTEAPVRIPRVAEPAPVVEPVTVPKEAAEPVTTPDKSASDLEPVVRQKLSELSNGNLKNIAKSFEIDPEKYDFTKREALREGGSKHPVERQKLVDDILGKMHDEEVTRHGMNAEKLEEKQTFNSPARNNQSKAEIAADLFKHRLNGAPVDEFGNPSISGGAPDVVPNLDRLAEEHIKALFPRGVPGARVLESSGLNINPIHEVNIGGRTGLVRMPGESGTSEVANQFLSQQYPGEKAVVLPRETAGSSVYSPEEINEAANQHLKDYERSTAQHTYEKEPGELVTKHRVTITDEHGNPIGKVEAVEDISEPGTWRIQSSESKATPGSHVGRDAYKQILDSAKAEAKATGSPITVLGDAVQSPAAEATWRALGKEYGPVSTDYTTGRSSITLSPEKSSGIPRIGELAKQLWEREHGELGKPRSVGEPIARKVGRPKGSSDLEQAYRGGNTKRVGQEVYFDKKVTDRSSWEQDVSAAMKQRDMGIPNKALLKETWEDIQHKLAEESQIPKIKGASGYGGQDLYGQVAYPESLNKPAPEYAWDKSNEFMSNEAQPRVVYPHGRTYLEELQTALKIEKQNDSFGDPEEIKRLETEIKRVQERPFGSTPSIRK